MVILVVLLTNCTSRDACHLSIIGIHLIKKNCITHANLTTLTLKPNWTAFQRIVKNSLAFGQGICKPKIASFSEILDLH